jgi:hypothetical protein
VLATTPQREAHLSSEGGTYPHPERSFEGPGSIGGNEELSRGAECPEECPETFSPRREAFAEKLARVLRGDLPGLVRRGWVAEPVRFLPLPAEVAAVLGRGIPRGRVCEVVGTRSSGRTSFLYAVLAAVTAAGEVAAWVDFPGAFDPPSAARAGVDLSAVLWVRPPSARVALRCAELILEAGGFALAVLDFDSLPALRLGAQSWLRLARAAERSGTALLLLASQRAAGSFAALSLVLEQRQVLWRRGGPRTGRGEGAPALLDGIESRAVLARSKLGPAGKARALVWGVPEALPGFFLERARVNG